MSTQTQSPPPRRLPKKIQDDPELRSFFEGLTSSLFHIWENNKDNLVGEGTPEGNVTANVGTRFIRKDGGAGTVLYIKESGTGSTGWAAK